MPTPIKLTAMVESEFKRLMAKETSHLLRAEDVVDAAQPEDSPLHRFFTWDDDVAAHRYRLEEARFLIRSYTVYNKDLEINVRAFTSLQMDREGGGGFRLLSDVMQRADLRQEAVRTALIELQRTKSKYEHVVELAKVWDAINDVGAGATASAKE